MSSLALKVENLSKKYHIGTRNTYNTIRESIINALTTSFLRLKNIGKSIQKEEIIWALKDISFDVKHGDVIGIIGQNGAGKSTLLKILTRITHPTHGRITLKGRIASLLEVGTGFHPELTGKENIYLNGAILGMNRYEISRKFDEIVDFAEIEKFLNTPVKRYSSGMYMRLAFAVAAHLEPEILLVDEVLAVGDYMFQKKCLGKMEEVAKEGRTVLFVSHNMSAIRSLCEQVILLDSGNIIRMGNAEEIISDYLCGKSNIMMGECIWDEDEKSPGNTDIKARAIRIINSKGITSDTIIDDEEAYVEIDYHIFHSLRDVQIGFQLLSSNGTIVLCTGDGDNEYGKIREPGLYRSRCKIPKNLLNSGTYLVKLNGHIPRVKILFPDEILLPFTVIQSIELGGYGRRPGVIRPILDWEIRKIEKKYEKETV
ncbi:MAG: ABC transporter ATP-binding protein [bacterium]